MFTSPNGEFFFSVVPTREGEKPTPLGAIRLQFMVQNIIETANELERRGVKFLQMPARVADNSAFLIGSFHTPNGIGIELWGFDSKNEFDPWKKTIHGAPESSENERMVNPIPDLLDRDQLVTPPSEQYPVYRENLSTESSEESQATEVEYLDGSEF